MKKFMFTPPTENRAAQSKGMEFMLATTSGGSNRRHGTVIDDRGAIADAT